MLTCRRPVGAPNVAHQPCRPKVRGNSHLAKGSSYSNSRADKARDNGDPDGLRKRQSQFVAQEPCGETAQVHSPARPHQRHDDLLAPFSICWVAIFRQNACRAMRFHAELLVEQGLIMAQSSKKPFVRNLLQLWWQFRVLFQARDIGLHTLFLNIGA